MRACHDVRVPGPPAIHRPSRQSAASHPSTPSGRRLRRCAYEACSADEIRTPGHRTYEYVRVPLLRPHQLRPTSPRPPMLVVPPPALSRPARPTLDDGALAPTHAYSGPGAARPSVGADAGLGWLFRLFQRRLPLLQPASSKKVPVLRLHLVSPAFASSSLLFPGIRASTAPTRTRPPPLVFVRRQPSHCQVRHDCQGNPDSHHFFPQLSPPPALWLPTQQISDVRIVQWPFRFNVPEPVAIIFTAAWCSLLQRPLANLSASPPSVLRLWCYWSGIPFLQVCLAIFWCSACSLAVLAAATASLVWGPRASQSECFCSGFGSLVAFSRSNNVRAQHGCDEHVAVQPTWLFDFAKIKPSHKQAAVRLPSLYTRPTFSCSAFPYPTAEPGARCQHAMLVSERIA